MSDSIENLSSDEFVTILVALQLYKDDLATKIADIGNTCQWASDRLKGNLEYIDTVSKRLQDIRYAKGR